MSVSMTNTQQVKGTLSLTNRLGGPATVDSPVWSVDDPSIVAIEVAADNMSVVARPAAPGTTVGSTDVVFTADADLGEGVKPLELRGTITITSAEAAAGAITFEAPEEIP